MNLHPINSMCGLRAAKDQRFLAAFKRLFSHGAIICWMAAWQVGCDQAHRGAMDLPGIVETQEVRLSSKVGGRIVRVLVQEGERAQANQPLVEFECEELQAKRAQLVALQDAAQAKLDMMCNGPLPEQIAAARSSMDAAEARLSKLVAGWRVEEIEMAKQEVEIWKA
ncbi:MAG: hypothetical protein ABL921_29995, partial [Pirellula sp.]